MKKLTKTTLAIFIAMAFNPSCFASNLKNVTSQEDLASPKILIEESYSVGYEYSRALKLLIEKTEKEHKDLKFDRKMILTGITDVLLNMEPVLDKKQRSDALTNLDVLTATEEKDPLTIENYQNGKMAQEQAKKVKGAMATASGLLYHVVSTVKNGARPNKNSLVTLKYTGSLVNGKEFDSSARRENSSRFIVKDLHKGLQEGVLLMKEGERYEFIIPPELAYGSEKQPGIPAGSTLYYDVTLVKVKQPIKN